MKNKHKKKIVKLFTTLIAMLVVTIVGYFKGYVEENPSEQILAEPRYTRSII